METQSVLRIRETESSSENPDSNVQWPMLRYVLCILLPI